MSVSSADRIDARRTETSPAMTELFAGIAGGVGLLIAGMWLLTENLKTLASWRLRRSASRWTANP